MHILFMFVVDWSKEFADCERGDVEDLRRKICAYPEDPGIFAHIGRLAPEWVQRFSSDEFARALIRIATHLRPGPKIATCLPAYAAY